MPNASSGLRCDFELAKGLVQRNASGGGEVKAAFAGGLGDADGVIVMLLNEGLVQSMRFVAEYEAIPFCKRCIPEAV